MEVSVQNQYQLSPIINEAPLSNKTADRGPSSIFESRDYQRLKEIIQDEKRLLQIAFCFRIHPTPLRKIKENGSPSRYILNRLQKVETELSRGVDLNDFLFKSPLGKRLITLYRLYQKEGSLERVGKLMNLSRERVRQLLNKGTKLGLFEYKIRSQIPANLSKEKITEDYKNILSLKRVANYNGISMHQLSRILLQHRLTSRELNAIRIEGRRMYCINQYKLFVNKWAGHPSTTDLEKTSDGTSLFNKINRLWGSMDAFRKELDIRFSSRHRKTRVSQASY